MKLTKEHVGMRLLVALPLDARAVISASETTIPVFGPPTERLIQEFSPDSKYVRLSKHPVPGSGEWFETDRVTLLAVLGPAPVKAPGALQQQNIRPMTVLESDVGKHFSESNREAARRLDAQADADAKSDFDAAQQTRWRRENDQAQAREFEQVQSGAGYYKTEIECVEPGRLRYRHYGPDWVNPWVGFFDNRQSLDAHRISNPPPATSTLWPRIPATQVEPFPNEATRSDGVTGAQGHPDPTGVPGPVGPSGPKSDGDEVGPS